MKNIIVRQKLAAYRSGLAIGIARSFYGTFEFDKVAEMLELGYDKVQNLFNK